MKMICRHYKGCNFNCKGGAGRIHEFQKETCLELWYCNKIKGRVKCVPFPLVKELKEEQLTLWE